jgi:hypothetical protein
MFRVLVCTTILTVGLTDAQAAIVCTDSFNPGGVGQLAGIRYDHVADRLYIYASFDNEILTQEAPKTGDNICRKP